MSSLSEVEAEKRLYQEQLEIVVGQIRDDPENGELQALHEELKSLIDMLDENIAELKPKQAPAAAQSAAPESHSEKWSRESHPAFRKEAVAPTEEKEEILVTYQVNDTVMAKWVTGDKAFYPARITSVTGSSTAPIYTVKFKSYDNTETLRSRDIRPINNKRKAEGQSSESQPPAPGVVSSAGATVYSDVKNETSNSDASKPPKPKKIKGNKALEAGKNKWQDFAKSKLGKQKKESMFRTPEGVNARVGFVGSGQTMRKDPTRSRHVYQMNEDLD